MNATLVGHTSTRQVIEAVQRADRHDGFVGLLRQCWAESPQRLLTECLAVPGVFLFFLVVLAAA